MNIVTKLVTFEEKYLVLLEKCSELLEFLFKTYARNRSVIARNFLMLEMLDHFSARDRSDRKFKIKNCARDRSDRKFQCSKCSRSMFLPLGLNSSYYYNGRFCNCYVSVYWCNVGSSIIIQETVPWNSMNFLDLLSFSWVTKLHFTKYFSSNQYQWLCPLGNRCFIEFRSIKTEY